MYRRHYRQKWRPARVPSGRDGSSRQTHPAPRWVPEVPTSRSLLLWFFLVGHVSPPKTSVLELPRPHRVSIRPARGFSVNAPSIRRDQRRRIRPPPPAQPPSTFSKVNSFDGPYEERATIRDGPCRARWFRIIPALPGGAQRRRRRRAPHCRGLCSCRWLCRCRPPRLCLIAVCAGLARGPIMLSVHVPCSPSTAVVALFLVRPGSTLRG